MRVVVGMAKRASPARAARGSSASRPFRPLKKKFVQQGMLVREYSTVFQE
jgi:hypothetical protein